MMIYSVRHVTKFRYKPAVRESVREVRMQPRSDEGQRCLSFSLDVRPAAAIMQYRDFLGNVVHHFDIAGTHSELTVKAQAVVDVLPAPDPMIEASRSWDDLDALVAGGDHWEMLLPSAFAHPTPLLEELFSEMKLERRGTPLELLLEITQSIHENFAYVPNSTMVDSPIDHALAERKGVCQDFAHIMTALVRKLRIPCRYVSGYLFHADKVKDRSPAGATHAWVEAYLGEAGWVAFDPTNNLLGSERHIHVAVGRDYADVPPTRGVYKGEAESELSVRVVVAPVDAPQPDELPPAIVLRTKRPEPKTAS